MARAPKSKTIILLLLTLAILCGIAGLVVGGGSLAGALNGLKDGKSVSCSVTVNAPLFGTNLQITGTPTCQSQGSCFVSPLHTLSITSIQGQLGLWQSGVLYASQDVDQSRLSGAQSYALTACVPQEAGAVRIGIITETGGVVNDQAVNIN